MDSKGLFRTAYPFSLLTAVFVFWICWLAAALADTGWFFGMEVTSALGVTDDDPSKYFFNFGCIFAGVILSLGGVARSFYTKGSDRNAGLCFIPSGILLAIIGAIPMDVAREFHYTVAFIFAAFIVMAVLFSTKNEWDAGRYISSVPGIVTLIVCFSVSLTLDLPFAENWCILVATFWMFIDTTRIAIVYRNGVPSPTPSTSMPPVGNH